MSRVSSLYRLQEIDSTLDHSRSRVAEIEIILENDAAVLGARAKLEEAEKALADARVDRNQAEHNVETQRQKIKQTEDKLYGGSISNPKELQDLQMESESLKRYLETLEDRLLDAMLKYEEVETEYEGRTADYELVTAERGMEHKNLQEERQNLEAMIEKLINEREAAQASVAEDDLRRYQKARSKLGGSAVVLLQDGSCAACGLAVPRSALQTISQGSELILCDQCGRILYAG